MGIESSPIPKAFIVDNVTLAQDGITLSIKDGGVSDAKLTTQPFKYVGSDLVEDSIANSTTETTLSSVTIPANTVKTGIVINSSVKARTGNNVTCTFRVKVGVAGSEVTKETVTVVKEDAVVSTIHSSLLWYEESATWTGAVNVIVTAEWGTASETYIATAHSLIVEGY